VQIRANVGEMPSSQARLSDR